MTDDELPVVPLPVDGLLDLHAFAPGDVHDVVHDYLDAARALGLGEIRLVHGRGTGAQRAVVHRLLAQHPLVADYWDAPESHLGATIVKLKP